MKKHHIVIIDDDNIILQILLRTLADHYQITCAYNAEEGLQAIRRFHPDLVLMDIVLPDISGIELCRQIKADKVLQPIPVIFLTNIGDDEVILEAFQAGGADYISKPYHREVLLGRIRVHITLATQLKAMRSTHDHLRDELVIRKEVENELFEKRKTLEYEISLRQDAQDEMKRYADALEHTKTIQEETTAELCSVNEYLRNILIEKDRINSELQQANAMKDRLFAVISHDLKSGVGNIATVLDLICDGRIEPEEQAAFLIESQKSSHNLYSLLEEILLWSRQQRDMIHFAPTPLVLSDLVTNVFRTYQSQAVNKHISLLNNIPSNLILTADQFMLKSILSNLVSNAIKFTPDSGQVEIGLNPDESHGQYLEILVRDNGVGISPENQDKIFRDNEFFTTRGTQSEAGTGLGLGICKEFAERHGGSLRFESIPGQGTTFFVHLPLINVSQSEH